MPSSAKADFDEDIKRARAILSHAQALPQTSAAEKMLRDDLLRSAWMFGVGAMDAYFCDAYTDLLTRLLRAKQYQPKIAVPPLSKIHLPMDAILASYNQRINWKWRMAARALMENENVLDTQRVKSHLNKMVHGDKLFTNTLLTNWISAPGWSRWFGPQGFILQTHLAGGPAPHFDSIRESINSRFDAICQRRHDCIHNCDRPKVRPQRIEYSSVTFAINDIEWLVERINNWIDSGFCSFLTSLGFSAVTRNKVGC